MNVFDFRQTLVNQYADFTRSFTRIKAEDIRSFVDKELPRRSIGLNLLYRSIRIFNLAERWNLFARPVS